MSEWNNQANIVLPTISRVEVPITLVGGGKFGDREAGGLVSAVLREDVELSDVGVKGRITSVSLKQAENEGRKDENDFCMSLIDQKENIQRRRKVETGWYQSSRSRSDHRWQGSEYRHKEDHGTW
jgi:hypothetical protein